MFKYAQATAKNFLIQSIFVLLIAQSQYALGNNATQNYVEDDSTNIGEYTVHYTVFNSQFVPANIANTFNIVRGKDQALINISVLDNNTGKTVAAKVTGAAKNLIQQTKNIDFKTIDECDAVYYIGTLRHTNEEVIHFNVQVTVAGKPHTVKFTRKLYTES